MAETELVKTALLNKWEIANVGKDGCISKHIKEITPKQMYAIMIDSLKAQIKKMPEGFTIDIDGYKVDVSKIEAEESFCKDYSKKSTS